MLPKSTFRLIVFLIALLGCFRIGEASNPGPSMKQTRLKRNAQACRGTPHKNYTYQDKDAWLAGTSLLGNASLDAMLEKIKGYKPDMDDSLSQESFVSKFGRTRPAPLL